MESNIDPIYKTPRFHAGMDFSGNMGTHIFATGNGVVTRAGWYQGYGNAVVINHGYGYETLWPFIQNKGAVRNPSSPWTGHCIYGLYGEIDRGTSSL